MTLIALVATPSGSLPVLWERCEVTGNEPLNITRSTGSRQKIAKDLGSLPGFDIKFGLHRSCENVVKGIASDWLDSEIVKEKTLISTSQHAGIWAHSRSSVVDPKGEVFNNEAFSCGDRRKGQPA